MIRENTEVKGFKAFAAYIWPHKWVAFARSLPVASRISVCLAAVFWLVSLYMGPRWPLMGAGLLSGLTFAFYAYATFFRAQARQTQGLLSELTLQRDHLQQQLNEERRERQAKDLAIEALQKENVHLQEVVQAWEEINALNLHNAKVQYDKEQEALRRHNEEVRAAHKKVTDSINYAHRIQRAMLPSTEVLREMLPQSFVMYQPRDIVSGDFFWFAKINYKVVLVVGDCTGHGVPGAFMSTIGMTLLHEIVHGKGILQPSEIIAEMNQSIRHLLGQDEGSNRDGMDMAVCILDYMPEELASQLGITPQLQFAGASVPLIVVQNGAVLRIKGDNVSVGGYHKGNNGRLTISSHSLPLEQVTAAYMFSDGYQDQFGGGDNKKFSSRRLERLLLDIHHLPASAQEHRLFEVLKEWAGDTRQTDDVLVMGFRALG